MEHKIPTPNLIGALVVTFTMGYFASWLIGC